MNRLLPPRRRRIPKPGVSWSKTMISDFPRGTLRPVTVESVSRMWGLPGNLGRRNRDLGTRRHVSRLRVLAGFWAKSNDWEAPTRAYASTGRFPKPKVGGSSRDRQFISSTFRFQEVSALFVQRGLDVCNIGVLALALQLGHSRVG